MFGRLIPARAGSLCATISRSANVSQGLALAPVRLSSQAVTADGEKSNIMKTVERWDALKEKYHGPQRDMVNFPPPVIPEHTPNVRMFIIPQSFFDFFYEKTGVTGPYVFMATTILALRNKEYLFGHDWMDMQSSALAFGGMYYFLSRRVAKFDKRQADREETGLFTEPLEEERTNQVVRLNMLEDRVREEERYSYVMDCNKENVHLQLEAEYRERLAQVHKEVKKRLDYQVELEATKRRTEQEHMVNWIVEGVVKGITPKQEQNAITSCLGTLKELSKTNKVSFA